MNLNPNDIPYSEEYEDGMRVLNEYVGLSHDNQEHQPIKRAICKHTDCGAWIDINDNGIRLGSIVEGCDFGTAIYPLPWSQVTSKAISDRLEAIEMEAGALWIWANEGGMEAGLDVPDTANDFLHLGPEGRSC